MSGFQKLSPPAKGDQDRRWTLLAVVIPMTILSTATVVVRLYTRTKVIRNVGWDDYTIVAAQVLTSYLCISLQSLKL